MNPILNRILLFASITLLITACKKKNISPPPSSDAFISTFIFRASDNPSIGQDVAGTFSHDTIYVVLQAGTNPSSLIPTINYTGLSVSPASNVAQNFANTVTYIVTAETGIHKAYKVVTRVLSNAKEMTSFILKKSNNPGLNEDIPGIISGDSIVIYLPVGISTTSLIPTVTYVGRLLSPTDQQASDFTWPVSYSISAEDGSVRTYRVYVSANRSIFLTGEDGYLYSLNSVNGAVQWKYYTGAQATPTFYNGTVFVAGTNNAVYAINSSNGSLKWKSTPPLGSFGLTVPAVEAGKLYFAGTGYLDYPNSIYSHYVSFVYTLNTETGAKEWLDTLFTNYQYTLTTITNVSVKGNVVCLYDIFNGIFVYNAADGSESWSKVDDMLGQTNPAITANAIYYGNERGMRALNATDGQQLWQIGGSPNTPTVFSSATISNNVIYSVGDHSTLLAIDLNGVIKWQHYMGPATYYSPLLNNNTLYVLNSYNDLSAYSIEGGVVKWTKNSYSTQPVVCNNEVFVCDINKRLNCLDATTGNIKWTSAAGNNFSQPACVMDTNGNAYHITDSGDQQ